MLHQRGQMRRIRLRRIAGDWIYRSGAIVFPVHTQLVLRLVRKIGQCSRSVTTRRNGCFGRHSKSEQDLEADRDEPRFGILSVIPGEIGRIAELPFPHDTDIRRQQSVVDVVGQPQSGLRTA